MGELDYIKIYDVLKNNKYLKLIKISFISVSTDRRQVSCREVGILYPIFQWAIAHEYGGGEGESKL